MFLVGRSSPNYPTAFSQLGTLKCVARPSGTTQYSWIHGFVAYPTDPFTIFEPQNQEIGTSYVVQERRATEFEVVKGSIGYQNPDIDKFCVFKTTLI